MVQVLAQQLSIDQADIDAASILWAFGTLIDNNDMHNGNLEFADGFSGQAFPRLREGSLDLVIGRIGSTNVMQGLQAQALFRYDMTVVARAQHPLAKARSLSELLESDWILSHAQLENDSVMQDLFGIHGLQAPRQRIQLTHSGWLAFSLLRSIDILSFWPWPLLEAKNSNGDLVALNLKERFAYHEVGIIRRAHEASSHPAMRFTEIFLNQVRTAAKSNDPNWKRLFYTLDMLLENL